jgi:hypothetical protein
LQRASSTRSWRSVKEYRIEQKRVRSADEEEDRRKVIRGKVRVGLAAFGTLAAVAGIGVVINGGLYFNTTKVLVGVAIIVVSTILYVTMLFVSRND